MSNEILEFENKIDDYKKRAEESNGLEFSLNNVDLAEIKDYISNTNITDIDWNGRVLWINDITKGRIRENKILTEEFVNNLAIRISNLMNKPFNKEHPVLEAETSNLRFSFLHNSITDHGTSLSIRKTPEIIRLSEKEMYETKYINEHLHNFFENAIKAHCTIVICGLPSVGKTEFLKYLTKFIPEYERVITIEDRKEIHYKEINPDKDCVEIKISNELSFPEAISFALSHNAKWTVLSEARGAEVEYLMNNLSSGTHVLTTLHTSDVRKVPDRLANMLEGKANDRFINDVFDFIDIAVLITSNVTDNNSITRRIEQVGVFTREDGINKTNVLYEDGKINADIPKDLMRKFLKEDIKNPFIKTKPEMIEIRM